MINRIKIFWCTLLFLSLIVISGCNSESVNCNPEYNFTIDSQNLKSSCDIMGTPSEDNPNVQVLQGGEDYIMKLEKIPSSALKVYVNNEYDDEIISSIIMGFNYNGFYTIKVCASDNSCLSKWVKVEGGRDVEKESIPIAEKRVVNDLNEDTQPVYSDDGDDIVSVEETFDATAPIASAPKSIPNAPPGFEFCCLDTNGQPVWNKIQSNSNATPVRISVPNPPKEYKPITVVEPARPTVKKPDVPAVKEPEAVTVTSPTKTPAGSSNDANEGTGRNVTETKPVEAKPLVIRMTQEEAETKLNRSRKNLKLYDYASCSNSNFNSGSQKVIITPKTYIKLQKIKVASNTNWKANIQLSNLKDGTTQFINNVTIIDSATQIGLSKLGLILFPNERYELTISPASGSGALQDFSTCSGGPLSDAALSMDFSGSKFISQIYYTK